MLYSFEVCENYDKLFEKSVEVKIDDESISERPHEYRNCKTNKTAVSGVVVIDKNKSSTKSFARK